MSRNDLDYVVINTSYTFRLIDKLAFNKIDTITENTNEKYDGNGVYRISHLYNTEQEKYSKIEQETEFIDSFEIFMEPINKFIDNCLFIHDMIGGQGLYKIGNDDEIEKVLKVLDENEIDKNGIVCLKCTNRSDIIGHLNILKDLDYCKMFGYAGDLYIDTDEMIITVVNYDTESG